MSLFGKYALVVCGIVMASCAAEPFYSCNKEADKWVKEHLDEVHSMSRSDWMKLEPTVGRACYVAFTTEQRIVFWDERLSELLKLEWNELEREHISAFCTFLAENPEIFEPDMLRDDELLYDKFDRFVYEWMEYAINTLGWTKRQIGAVIASGYDLVDTKGAIDVPEYVAKPSLRSAESKDCHCHIALSFCELDDCKIREGCREKRLGCGAVMLQPCDGLCYNGEKPEDLKWSEFEP